MIIAVAWFETSRGAAQHEWGDDQCFKLAFALSPLLDVQILDLDKVS